MKNHGYLTVAALLISVICNQACTDLRVYKVDGVTQLPDELGSIPYILPKKTFLVSATYVLNNCRTIEDPTSNKPSLLLDVDTTINVVANNEADEDERYFIPYTKLRSLLKEINFTVESYSNQTLKSFNATINDQTGPIITAAIGTVIKIAALALAGAKMSEEDELCDQGALLALATVAGYKKRLSDIAKSPVTGAPSQSDTKDSPKPTPNQDAQIAELQKDINKLISETLTSKVVLTWSPQLSELNPWIAGRDAATRTLTSDQAVQKWLSAKGRQWLADYHDNKHIIFIVIDVPSWSHPPTKEISSPITDGLVLRDPALGILRVCKGKCPTPKNDVTSVDNVVSATNVVVPQFGRKLILPLHNSVAQNSVLDVSISEDGVITKIGVHSTSTAAASTTALGANADAAKNALDARNKAKADALTKAQNKAKDENKTLADCLEAQKTIVKDGGIPVGSCQ